MASDGALSWFEINVPDAKTAQDFYGKVLPSWSLAPMEGFDGYVIINAGGAGIGALQQSTDGDPKGRNTRTYFLVEDLEDALARVRQNGGAVEQDRMQVPGDQWIGTGRDPYGNAIGFATNNAAR